MFVRITHSLLHRNIFSPHKKKKLLLIIIMSRNYNKKVRIKL